MHHHHEHDDHHHHDEDLIEEPLDAANQSLADSLKASFRILKAIMVVVCVLYLVSNVRNVDSHEQAVVLRLGALRGSANDAGLMFALPMPIDEIVMLPTRSSNIMEVTGHTFKRNPNEIDRSLDHLTRGMESGLVPGADGALITADGGLVHTKWKVTYKFLDPIAYVRNIAGEQLSAKNQLDAAQALVETFVESEGIRIATEKTAEQMIRTDTDTVQSLMRDRVNERLREIDCGIVVDSVEMDEQTPPIAVRRTFNETQTAENNKQRVIRMAEEEELTILSGAAGAIHVDLIKLLDRIDAAKAAGEPVAALEAELDTVLRERVEGEAGRMIKDAGSYFAEVEGQMRSDVELYRVHLPEFKRTPQVLIARLWQEVQQSILDNPEITKMFRPPGLREFRVIIPLDPEQERILEEQRLQGQKFDPKKLLPQTFHAIGPNVD